MVQAPCQPRLFPHRIRQGYDVALIKLEVKNGRSVPEGNVMPVCLATAEFQDHNNGSLFMAGYGRRRIPHCLTNTLGPEKFQVCGREIRCANRHRTRKCTLNFKDENWEKLLYDFIFT